jgi:Sec-independent protein translocase protein TatA
LLKRVAESERRIYDGMAFGEKQLVMLAYVAKQRAQLERSFRTAIADMKQSQRERSQQQARQPQPAQTAQPASAPVHPSAGPQRSSVLPSPPTPVSNLPP